jgi:hypothetical protein
LQLNKSLPQQLQQLLQQQQLHLQLLQKQLQQNQDQHKQHQEIQKQQLEIQQQLQVQQYDDPNNMQHEFDNRTNYIKTRYQKHISSFLNVDSRQRNTDQFPNPGNYNIYLNKEFKYIQSITLSSAEFREAPTPINSTNNRFTWITDYTGVDGVNPGTKVQYSTIIPSAFYTLENFVKTVESTINSVQHDLPGFSPLDGLFPSFGLFINPFNRSLVLMERLEILPLSNIITTKDSNIIQINLIYQSAYRPSNMCDVKRGEGYPFRPDYEDVPIIMTGLELFYQYYGNIPALGILEGIPFYTKQQVENDPALKGKNYYECGGLLGDTFYYYLHVFDFCGKPANASYTGKFELNMGNTIDTSPGHPPIAVVGRALPVEILTDCVGTFGNFLGLTTADTSAILNTNINASTKTVVNTIPWKVIGSGQLSLSTIEYIFMRIGTISKPFDLISDNLTNASGGTINRELLSTDNQSYFAKLIFSDRDPGDICLDTVGGKKTFYNSPLVSLSDLSVQFLGANGEIMLLNQNHSFTLEIIELREVLNDTLMDSRTGNIIELGK